MKDRTIMVKMLKLLRDIGKDKYFHLGEYEDLEMELRLISMETKLENWIKRHDKQDENRRLEADSA